MEEKWFIILIKIPFLLLDISSINTFFVPSCQGRIYADFDSTIWQNKYKDVNVEKLVQLHIDSLKTKYSQVKVD